MSTISEIKERTDIVSLVSEHVQLAKAGKNYRGLCPFHSEKHGSFFVFPDRQTWHCFGACGTGGDVFSFVMKKENVEFREALAILAARAGIRLERDAASAPQRDTRSERVLETMEAAAAHYRQLLLEAESGRKARTYLENRHIQPEGEAGTSFRLGYSLEGWNNLKDHLRGLGFSEEDMIDAGLLVQREDGSTYDRFRDRLMFPILDEKERVTGFGARAFGDAQPKYINSPQTRVFDKSRALYGIHRARSAARKADRIILVEGYTDVLQAHQHGWDNTVAPMGTSLTEHHARTLARLTKNINLALDADPAGQAAAMKTIRETTGRFRDAFGQRIVPQVGQSRGRASRAVLDADIRVITLPTGKDPDEIIAQEPEAWRQLVEKAIPYVQFYVDTLLRSVDTETARGKRELIALSEPIIAELADPIERSTFYSRLSRSLGVSERELMAELSESERARTRQDRPTQASEQPRKQRRPNPSAIEEYCLRLLLTNPELRPYASSLSREHFEATENSALFVAWHTHDDVNRLRDSLDAPLAEHLDFVLSEPFPAGIPRDNETDRLALRECILRLQEHLLKRQHFMIETTLQRERKEQGADAELATLERAGVVDSNEQLRQVFLQKEQKQHLK